MGPLLLYNAIPADLQVSVVQSGHKSLHVLWSPLKDMLPERHI